ncbi:MAG: hypothetical protein EDM74_07325, partial [Armatimonadetes bacterium]
MGWAPAITLLSRGCFPPLAPIALVQCKQRRMYAPGRPWPFRWAGGCTMPNDRSPAGFVWDDPSVLTCSIHEDGRYLYPGTGAVEETGPAYAAVNVPLPPGTTGDTWLWAFEQGILPALEAFAPEALVLQMGTDAHFLDPLAHLNVAAQDWLEAVRLVKEAGLPIVALGGGGYSLDTVPR